MRRLPFISFLLIASLSIIVYINSFDNGFHYDDEHYIVTNPFLEKWDNIPYFFTTPRYYSDDKLFTGHYRPLVYVTYALNKILGGDNPVGYHVVNLAFHVGAAMLLFLIIKAMLGNGAIALVTALVFAVHPFNSEVVNYITARSSVMSGFFYLLGFYCWVKFRGKETDVRRETLDVRRKNGSSPSRLTSYVYLASLLAFLFGMLSKEVVITLPVMLWLYDIYFVHPLRTPHSVLRTLYNWRTYLPYLPFILSVLVPYFVIRKIKYNVFTIPTLNREIYLNLLTETRVLIKYIIMLIIPTGQSVYHDIDVSVSVMDWRVIFSIALLTVIGVLTFLLARSNNYERRIASFFSLWFFVTLLPTTILPLNDILQENRGYLAGISFAVILALFSGWLLQKARGGLGRLIFPLCLILFLIVYSAATLRRNNVWHDEYTLWSDVLEKYPRAYKAYYSLGRFYMEEGDREKAIEYFKRTIDIYPSMYQAYNRIGIMYGEKKEAGVAIEWFKRAIEIRPDFHKAYYNLATTYYLNDNVDSAVENYKKALEISPHYPDPYMALGEIYQEKGDIPMAKDMYEKVIYYTPSDARPYFRLGLIYEAEGNNEEAVRYYESVLKINPGLENAKMRLNMLRK